MSSVHAHPDRVHSDAFLVPPEFDDFFELMPFEDATPWHDDPARVATHAADLVVPPADWLDDQASFFRSQEHELAAWLAGRINGLAHDWRTTRATDPREHDARIEVLDDTPAFVQNFPPADETIASVKAMARREHPRDTTDQAHFAFGALRSHYERLLADYRKLAKHAKGLQFRADSCVCADF